MGRSTIAIGLFIAAGALLTASSAGKTYAEEKQEAYVSPEADKVTLVREPLHEVEAQVVTLDHYTLPAGWVGGPHYHTGPVYVYVLEGAFAVDEEGKEPQAFEAGELYREPVGVPMQARNLNASEPLKLLVFQITPEGEPPMIESD